MSRSNVRAFGRRVLSQLRRLARGGAVGGLSASDFGSPEKLRSLRRRIVAETRRA